MQNKEKKISRIYKKKFANFKIFWARSVQPFDVYWIQTNKQTNQQTNKQTDKPNLYIDVLSKSSGVSKDIISTDTTFIVASQIHIELILLQPRNELN